jgi:two-component system cell cycle response regulator CpdR
MTTAQNVRIVIDCLKRAKPRGGGKLKPDLKQARDRLVALAEKGKRPLEEILDLASSIATIEMAPSGLLGDQGIGTPPRRYQRVSSLQLSPALTGGAFYRYASPKGQVTRRHLRDISPCWLVKHRDMSRLNTILLADDEPDLSEVIVAILTEAGYAVLAASDGYDAVRILADNWVNLLITDVSMPGIDGFELARQAKVMRPNLSVIYLSGDTVMSAKSPGPIYGPILQKPLRLRDLVDEVARQLG